MNNISFSEKELRLNLEEVEFKLSKDRIFNFENKCIMV